MAAVTDGSTARVTQTPSSTSEIGEVAGCSSGHGWASEPSKTAWPRCTHTPIAYNANALGVVAVDSTMMAGSAAVFLPHHPYRDSLYAFALARDCSAAPTPFCITVPSDGCPVLPVGAAANLTFRAYLEPATATGPSYDELVVDRALLVN